MIGLYQNNRVGTQVVKQQIPCVNPATQGLIQKKLTLRISNTTAAAAVAALFDASGKFELKEGIFTQGGVTIESLNYNYKALLNDLASGEQFCVVKTEFEVIAGDVASQQERSWDIYEDVRFTNGSNLIQQIEPGYGKNAYQQQDNRLTVMEGFGITRQRLMKIIMEPNTVILLKMSLGTLLTNG